MKTKHSFRNLSELMKSAEERQNRGMTLILYDDLSGEICDFSPAHAGLTLFKFEDIDNLFRGLYHLALPPTLMN